MEREIQKAILQKIGSRTDVRLFRNNTGAAWQGKAHRIGDNSIALTDIRRVVYGLCDGSCDLIGIRAMQITPDMVGLTIGQFVGIEVKSRKGRPSKNQRKFLEMITRFGGSAGIAKSVAEAEAILGATK